MYFGLNVIISGLAWIDLMDRFTSIRFNAKVFDVGMGQHKYMARVRNCRHMTIGHAQKTIKFTISNTNTNTNTDTVAQSVRAAGGKWGY